LWHTRHPSSSCACEDAVTVGVEEAAGAALAAVGGALDFAAATFSSGKLAGDDLADRRRGLLSSVSLLVLSISTEVNSGIDKKRQVMLV